VRSRSIRGTTAVAAIALLAVLGAVFLATVGIDALELRNDFQFSDSSTTYHEVARGEIDLESLGDVISISGNFLGPLIVIRLAGDNYYAILVLNSALLAFSVVSLARSLRLDAPKFLLVLLLNPITVSSTLSVNKEILAIAMVALLVRFYSTRSLPVLGLAMLMSVLVRWQMTMLLVVTLALLSRINPIRERRVTTLVVLLATLSLVYLLLEETLAPVRVNFQDAAAQYEGSGAFELLMNLQDLGWYWAIFPLKAAHLLFASGLRFDRLIAPTNSYNDGWQLLHSTSMLILFLVLVRRGRFTTRNDLVYLSLIYIAVFAITPIYAPRYFYPVYVFWAAALCSPDPLTSVLHFRSNWPRHRKARQLARFPA